MYQYKAHINEKTGEVQTVKEHSENTADLCRQYAIPVLKDFMYVMGLLHDCGKYQEDFQKRIDGANIRVEHSICGALVAKERYPEPIALMMEYCIAGHHSGIPDGGFRSDTSDMSTLCGRLKRKVGEFSAYQDELSIPQLKEKDVIDLLLKNCVEDGRFDEELFVDKYAFWTRYSFSCLTDADSVDTAGFCNDEKIRPLSTDFRVCLEKVDKKLDSFVCKTPLQKTRALLQKQVFEKAHTDAEIYLMNMPTGSGKTLASIKFGLERAILKKKKRIIYITSYNSIIDQTMQIFEDLFGESAEILRHQSTFSYEDSEECSYTEDYRKAARSAAENWDVESIIVTTAVQFFESIYANKRGKLRKLHNMADSILIFDEAHLMPLDFLQPCLRAIAYITRYLNSEAIFLTATMPDFSQLLYQYALKDSRIVDLVADPSLFSAFKKCRFQYTGEKSAEEILQKSANCPSCLMIVNKRKTAKSLYEKCSGKKFHLSTYMTSIDRQRVIADIRTELKQLEKDYPDGQSVPKDRRITIISTSLIEAGIDLDVYTVFRELSGLDSILQAGGRCNREGKRAKGEVYVFDFGDENRTVQDIKSNIVKGLFAKYGDISDLECIREYYQRLYLVNQEKIQEHTITKNCQKISSISFNKYGEEFELIDSRTVPLVVPRDDQSQRIVESLKYSGGSISIGRKLQKYTCSIYQQELDDLIKQHAASDFGTSIWCLTNPDYYEEETGISFEAKDYFI